MNKRLACCVSSLVASLLLTGCSLVDSGPSTATRAEVSVQGIEFLGNAGIPTGTLFDGTEIGGISGLAFNAEKGVYYAISDDESIRQPARFYTLDIDLEGNGFRNSSITVKDVTFLKEKSGRLFPYDSLDSESLAFTPSGNLFVVSEGTNKRGIPPFVDEFDLNGNWKAAFPIDGKFIPEKGKKWGVRHNRAFENLTITPDGTTAFVANEDTLMQDGPSTGIGQDGIIRFIRYDLASRTAVKEFLYRVEGITPKPGLEKADPENSVADILALDNEGTFLVLERYYDDAGLNTNKLYEVKTAGLPDVKDIKSLKGRSDLKVAKKRLLFDFAKTGVNKDDFEALVFGPRLADGRQSLIVASDNDFFGRYARNAVLPFRSRYLIRSDIAGKGSPGSPKPNKPGEGNGLSQTRRGRCQCRLPCQFPHHRLLRHIPGPHRKREFLPGRSLPHGGTLAT